MICIVDEWRACVAFALEDTSLYVLVVRSP